MSKIPTIPARNYTRVSGTRRIDLIVVHDMEAPETSDRAERCAQMFATTTREASTHFCVDNDSIVRCVADNDVAWCAPGANSDGLQIEHAGYAAQRADEWRDPYSERMLRRSAALAAELAVKYSIPVVWLRAPDLRAGRRGLTSHAEVSDAFRLSTHTDPGANFPVGHYLRMIHAGVGDERHNAGARAHKPAPETIAPGDHGWLVKRAQRLLCANGYSPGPIDGQFGPCTRVAVVRFQRSRALALDGIIGRVTWRELLKVKRRS